MTKTLILMRHAKSSWNDPFLQDHDRDLNERGMASAQVLGDWLRERGHIPEQALVSSARRTLATFELLGLMTTPQVRQELYHAGPDILLRELQRAQANTVLMLAHNPGIADFAGRLVNVPPAHDKFDDYPTGATLIASFDIENWQDAAWGRANTVEFAIPRQLGA